MLKYNEGDLVKWNRKLSATFSKEQVGEVVEVQECSAPPGSTNNNRCRLCGISIKVRREDRWISPFWWCGDAFTHVSIPMTLFKRSKK